MLTRTDTLAGVPSARLPAHSVWLLLLACLWLANLGYVSLTDPIEGRYAEIPREMLASGDWVTPELDGIPYLARPPLQYWATAAAYSLLGEAPWVSRLWTAVMGLVGMLLLAAIARPLVGRRAARLAGVVLVSSPLYLLLGHLNTLEMAPAVLGGVTLASLCRALRAQRGGTEERRWMLGAWCATGLGLLAAGPVALLLPAATLALHAALSRDFGSLRRLRPVAGVALLGVLAAPWFVLMSLRHPGFGSFYLARAFDGAFARDGAVALPGGWLIAPAAVLGFAPWIPAAVAGVRARVRAPDTFDTTRFLVLWCVAVLAFATVSGGAALPGSLLPIDPALALLAGRALATEGAAQRRALWVAEWIGVAAALACVGVACWFLWGIAGPRRAALFGRYVPWLLIGAATFVVGTRIAASLRLATRADAAVFALAVTWVLALQVVLSGSESLAPIESGRRIAQRLAPLTDSSTPLFAIGSWPESVPFYLRRQLVVVGDPGELEVEFAPGTPLWIPTLREFGDAWRSSRQPFAIVDRALLPALRENGIRVAIVAETQRAVIVERPEDR